MTGEDNQLALEEFRERYELVPGKAKARPKRKHPIETIDQLLTPPSLNGLELKPEQALSARLLRALLDLRRAGRLKATFTAIPNELPRPRGVRHLQQGAIRVLMKRKAIGVVTGASDWVFVWRGGGGWIELKDPGGQVVMRRVQRKTGPTLRPIKTAPGTLQPEQVLFRSWCLETGVHHAVCHSVEEALLALAAWGALEQLDEQAREEVALAGAEPGQDLAARGAPAASA
jgi:hypothetical protein